MSAARLPELSVVIASHNRRELLRRCLDSLAAQTADPGSFEVIVAADGSDDGSVAMAEAYEAPFAIRVLELPKQGKSAAVNAGVEAAAGAICLFLDDDIVASPELVAEHLAAHRRNPMAIGIGALHQQPPRRRDWYGRAYAAAWDERYRALESKDPDWTDCYGANLSVPRRALQESGGISTELDAIEDIELGFRLCAAGCVPVYLPRAHGVHDDEKSRRRTIADTWRYGRFCAEFSQRRPAAAGKLVGWFLDTTPREILLRRLLLALRMPPRALAAAGRAIPGSGRRQVWFGFVSRYTFWLGARDGMTRELWSSTTRGVPVLMYHAFGDDGERDRYVLPRRRFALQMRLLARLRFRAIGFDELAAALRDGRPSPRRSVVITIDDGYADNLSLALPVLRRHGMTATVFLVSDRLGGANDWTEEGAVAGRALMSLEEVEELRRGGLRLGAHTRTHPVLTELDDGALAEELSGSRERLEEALGEPIDTLAYPYGRFDERVAAAAERAGFAAAGTVEGRLASPADDSMTIPRIEIHGGESTLSFLRKLWFGGT